MLSVPLSLYIHFPWCVSKCPYCDFNSHALKNTPEQGLSDLSEKLYIQALLNDLKTDLDFFKNITEKNRKIHSIFMGGGTPSLFSPDSVQYLLNAVQDLWPFENTHIEITLEANPGAIEQEKFAGFRQAGINRLSIGVQSFDPQKLKKLARIHDGEAAMRAVNSAKKAGFTNFNIDLMHGLPSQTESEALADITCALAFQPPHLSWYQLTLEPHTLFYQKRPVLPAENILDDIERQGMALLQKNHYQPYEISAYCQKDFECRHNLNYWEFGDYIGIGAGAHGKITDSMTGEITRTFKVKHPKYYLESFHQSKKSITDLSIVDKKQIPFEFMLNALRLQKPISWTLFRQRTGLSDELYLYIQEKLTELEQKKLMRLNENNFEPTPLGRKFLNNILTEFVSL